MTRPPHVIVNIIFNKGAMIEIKFPWRNGSALDFYIALFCSGIQRLWVRAPPGMVFGWFIFFSLLQACFRSYRSWKTSDMKCMIFMSYPDGSCESWW